MSRQLNPSQIWSQVPVANRLIEVNTKTGFSLTAGSYSVRASSTQSGTIVLLAGTVTNTATISSVTTTQARCNHGGNSHDASGDGTAQTVRNIGRGQTRAILTSATVVTANSGVTETGAGFVPTTTTYGILELF